jgi:hypothetical protein
VVICLHGPLLQLPKVDCFIPLFISSVWPSAQHWEMSTVLFWKPRFLALETRHLVVYLVDCTDMPSQGSKRGYWTGVGLSLPRGRGAFLVTSHLLAGLQLPWRNTSSFAPWHNLACSLTNWKRKSNLAMLRMAEYEENTKLKGIFSLVKSFLYSFMSQALQLSIVWVRGTWMHVFPSVLVDNYHFLKYRSV